MNITVTITASRLLELWDAEEKVRMMSEVFHRAILCKLFGLSQDATDREICRGFEKCPKRKGGEA